ncbi:hypothetical protein BDW74DRAFT_144156 [Aspergillus multicolor]|uniref:NAD(P)-dependent alcohol dehydrogenase n=1 Tax=Aspergillus multicolor TaxID=41759 RepID=UPI003CCDE312
MTSLTHLPDIPSTMHAWVRRRRGPASTALELVNDFPTPTVPTGSSSDVLIRVSHVSLQANSEALMKMLPKLPLPGLSVPELELSGEVVAAGEGAPAEVRDAGTHVVAFQNIPLWVLMGRGVLAEYVRLPGNQVARIQSTVDMASASGVHGCGSTALKMIRTADVRDGHTVLVNGASGSVGSMLVQLCKLRGAKVVGVASGGNEGMVRGLGVDEFVDYRKHDPLPDYLTKQYSSEQFDFILDCVGTQPLFASSPAYLKPDGALINVGVLEGFGAATRNYLVNAWLPTWLGGVPRRYIMFSTPPNRDDTIYIADLIEKGAVRVPVDTVFDMEDAVDAYKRIATKRARGKVVVKVRSD